MLIEGDRVYLKPFGREHLTDLNYFEWLRTIEVVQWLGRDEYLNGISYEEVEEYVEDVWSNPYRHFYAVYFKDLDEFIGTATINFINQEQEKRKTADIGIMIGERKYWGKGLGRDILASISKFAFSSMAARKLTAGAMSPNVGVIKAFERVGFKEEGRIRNHLVDKDGHYVDHVLLGCFKEELLGYQDSSI